MFWLPAIFIVFEIIYIYNIDTLMFMAGSQSILKKYKSEDLKKYVESRSKDVVMNALLVFVLVIGEFIYFIFGLFGNIWIYSVVFILFIVIGKLLSKIINKEQTIEESIKMAGLEDFESNDVKLNRVLKLQELNGVDIKIHKWKYIIVPIIKILAFLSIIILHYHFKMI